MTTIEWTDETWNPTTGCDRISPGCNNCYALTMAKRLKGMGSAKYQNDGDERTSGPGFGLTVHPDTLDAPLRWRKPRKVFVNSMSDLFHKDVPDEFIAQVFAVMALTPQHTYQVLTKRPQRMADLLGEPTDCDYGWHIVREGAIHTLAEEQGIDPNFGNGDGAYAWPLPNVWLGTSIESDRYAFRGDHLRRTPAAVRFISAEPLLGPLPSLDLTGVDWLIVGGESGPGARPMHPDWVRDLRYRCQPGYRVTGHDHAGQHTEPVAGTAFFFKQWGEWCPPEKEQGQSIFDYVTDEDACQIMDMDGRLLGRPWGGWKAMGSPHRDGHAVRRYGKKAAGRELDGRTWDEFPVVAP